MEVVSGVFGRWMSRWGKWGAGGSGEVGVRSWCRGLELGEGGAGVRVG